MVPCVLLGIQFQTRRGILTTATQMQELTTATETTAGVQPPGAMLAQRAQRGRRRQCSQMFQELLNH
jgi:hypothetical protein